MQPPEQMTFRRFVIRDLGNSMGKFSETFIGENEERTRRFVSSGNAKIVYQFCQGQRKMGECTASSPGRANGRSI